jgi:hypothetical protein
VTNPPPSNNPFKYNPAAIKKAWVGLIGFVVTTLVIILQVGPDLIPQKWLPVVNVIIGVATFYGIFRSSNNPPGPISPPPEIINPQLDRP